MENEHAITPETEALSNEKENSGPEKEALIREIESGKATIAELKRALAAKDADIAALNQVLEEFQRALDERDKALAQAVAAYRGLVITANPGLLAELIAGDSIEAIAKSLESARAVMEKARREIEAEAARTRVPAGAPPRTPPDLTALSAREKIQYALGGS